jgi:hypothetical protein
MSEAAVLSRVFSALRGLILGLLGVVLSAYQGHVEYSAWLIFALIFVASAFNRYNWIAAFILAWLLALYLAPPKMIAWVGGLA